MSETLVLRDADLSDFYSPRENVLESSIKKSFADLEKLRSRDLASDSKIITEIENRLENQYFGMKYPQLDLGFLTMSNNMEAQVPISWRKTAKSEIAVPKFSTYSLFGDKSTNKFNIHFFKNKKFLEAVFNYYPATCSIMDAYNFGQLDSSILSNYATLFEKEGFSRVEFKGYKQGFHNSNYTVLFKGKLEKLKRYSRGDNMGVSIESTFDGLIPDSTLQKIEVAKKDFGDKIYIITETKPEEWNITAFTDDPLAVGIKNGYAYLIDPFDTTPLEELAAGTYRKEKSN